MEIQCLVEDPTVFSDSVADIIGGKNFIRDISSIYRVLNWLNFEFKTKYRKILLIFDDIPQIFIAKFKISAIER